MRRHAASIRTIPLVILATIGPWVGVTSGDLVPPPGWNRPDCTIVRGGAGAVTYTGDDGKTLTPTGQQLVATTYTYSVAALDLPNVLLAVHDDKLLLSRDAGCTWGAAGLVESDWARLVPVASGGAYAWGDNRRYLARIDVGSTGAAITTLALPLSSAGVVGFAAEPGDERHLRVGLSDGTTWDSADGGAAWMMTGSAPVDVSYAYRVAFDPRDPNHMLLGASSKGAFVSTDGGRSWVPSTGLSASGGFVNVFAAVISPADGSMVWCEGIDMGASGDEGIRHIYLSRDGGASFAPVVTETTGLILANGTPMWAHPTLANVLYFSFGAGQIPHIGPYGSDLFRYNARTKRLKKAHNDLYHRIFDIAFSPEDPSMLYLAVSHEVIEATEAGP
ncbi:MAG: dispase autolysis-inducing protein [Acidobacteria bacterium]|nr:dispase autolysis-inducing protein [Acidobacteriota bacterium]